MGQKEHQVLEVVCLDYDFHSCRRPSRCVASLEAPYQLKEETEQAGTSNGGQRPSLNSGFHFRRGWPIR
jgi:hypothetical protein